MNTPMLGRTLQRYRIVEEVGHGGMAVVYRGVDESLERAVAIKLLHPHLAARSEHRKRLAREAKAVARLRHPNILEIFDFSGEDSQEAFLVTELIEGRTLRAFAAEHPFDPPELGAACVHVLAGALAHAHAQGIIHRDLKPDNVMIHEAGDTPVVKLMDFGIAQIVDRDERMTVTGSLIGSPSHMAPEIINGEEADGRSDVFSLGTILYALVTDQLPFEAPSPGALLKKILDGDFPDPRLARPSVSDTLARVINDALATDRTARIPSALAFQQRLGEALEEVGFDRPEDLLTDFLRSPRETAPAVRASVVRSLMMQGHDAAEEGRTARALQCFGRVVSIVPGTGEAGEARNAIERLKRRRATRKRLAYAGGLLGIGLAGGLGAVFLTPARPVVPPAPQKPQPKALAPSPPEPRAPTSEPPTQALAAPSLKSNTAEASVARPAAPAAPQPPSPVAKQQEPPPAPARLSVHVKDVWARVLVDGVHKGQTPYEADLPAGAHNVRLESDCCRPVDFEATLAPGERREERHVLEPLPARLELHVQGAPGAGIMLDDQFEAYERELGGKPLVVPMKRDGTDWRYDRTVQLRVFAEGFTDHVSEVRLRAGQTQTLDIALAPAADD